MKLVIEKEEWQLLGQIVLETINYAHRPALSVHDVLVYEFSIEHAQAFKIPERRSRKLKLSMLLALRDCLLRQPLRNDAFWDVTLIQFRDKVSKMFSHYSVPDNTDHLLVPLQIVSNN